MTLSKRIREQRKRCNLSQEKVAELVGVSRQAVAKWETGQSAPSTENLFKLAEIFGTTVDLLLPIEKKEKKMIIHWKPALGALVTYGLIYLAGRIFGTRMEDLSLLGWLFGTDPQQHTYLYGWLLHQNLFWYAMGISVLSALFGKIRFAAVATGGFAIGLLAGELLGPNPAGIATGHTHYGWLIWGIVYVLSMAAGIFWELYNKNRKFA